MKKQRETEESSATARPQRGGRGGWGFRSGRGGRGFTLVELAIVITVVGLLLGASLIPMRMLEERRQLREEMQRMEIVRDAVVGYALRHRTRERTVKFVTLHSPRFTREFRLPAGRPYLPCPDWDGDGFEDRYPEGRNGFMQGLETRPDLTVTMTVHAARAALRPFYFYLRWSQPGLQPDSDDTSYSWRPYGECRTPRGAVPWRTLGVEPSDHWGNRHTYYADPVFSNAIFGFDRQTIADLYEPRLPRAPGFDPSMREDIPERDTGLPIFLPTSCPAVICDGARSDDCVQRNPSSSFASECEVGTNVILKAGGVADSRILPESPGGKCFPAGGVTDGLPFVLVSHGPNGRFAVNHWASLVRPLDASGVKAPVCNLGAWTDSGNEVNSSFPLFLAQIDELSLIKEAVNGNRGAPSNDSCGLTVGSRPGTNQAFFLDAWFFVWEPPGINDKSNFDDLLLWMTREELSVSVAGHIPRLPPMAMGYPLSPLSAQRGTCPP